MPASSRCTASATASITRSRRTCSAASSSGSARLRGRRRAPGPAARPRAIAWSAGSAATAASCCAASPTTIVADPKTPIARAVHDANFDTILMTFPIATLGQERGAGHRRDAALPHRSARVQRASAAARPQLRCEPGLRRAGEGLPRQRRSARRRRPSPRPTTRPAAGRRPGAGAPTAAAARAGSASVLMHYSMVQAAREADEPRLFDERVGYFSPTHARLRPSTSTARRSAATSRAGGSRRRIRTRRSPSR